MAAYDGGFGVYLKLSVIVRTRCEIATTLLPVAWPCANLRFYVSLFVSLCAAISAGTNLLSVAAHEIGHALGISHSTQRGALMYAWYDSYNPVLTLHSDDIAAIQHLYGTIHPCTSQSARLTPIGRPYALYKKRR